MTCESFLVGSAGAKKSAPSTPKSAGAEARNKAREEARRKLIAAKREAVSGIRMPCECSRVRMIELNL